MGNSRNEPRAAAETQMSPLLSSICFVPGDRQKFPQRNLLFSRREKAPNGERGRGHFVEQTCDGGENCRALGNGEREIEHSSREVVSVGPRIQHMKQHRNHASLSEAVTLLQTHYRMLCQLRQHFLTIVHYRYRKPNVLDGMLGKNIQIVVLYRKFFSSCHVNWDLIRESAE